MKKPTFRAGQLVYSKKRAIYVRLVRRGVTTPEKGTVWYAALLQLRQKGRNIAILEKDIRILTQKEKLLSEFPS